MMWRTEKWSLLPSHEDGSVFSDDNNQPQGQLRNQNSWSGKNGIWLITIFNIVVLSITLAVTGTWFYGESLNHRCWKVVNAYSPVTDSIELPLRPQRMKGTFLDVDGDIFRQSPSPEVDAAWENLTLHGAAYAHREDLIRIGKDPETAVKYPIEFGFGDDAYAIETDVIHKFHCLDMVRRDVHFDYYYGHLYPDGRPSERHYWHTNHCLYILLQSLRCTANTDIIPLTWMEDYPWPTPDFNIIRTCGNIDGVVRWEAEHRTDIDVLFSMKKPKGQKQVSATPELRKILEIEDGWDARNGVLG